MTALNSAWQAAATEMYQASGAQANGSSTAEAKATDASGNNDVSDVEYEEVNDKK